MKILDLSLAQVGHHYGKKESSTHSTALNATVRPEHRHIFHRGCLEVEEMDVPLIYQGSTLIDSRFANYTHHFFFFFIFETVSLCNPG
jgi:hypothetical protein